MTVDTAETTLVGPASRRGEMRVLVSRCDALYVGSPLRAIADCTFKP